MAQPNPVQDPVELYRRLLDDEVIRVELVDGEVVMHAAPGMLHGFGMAMLGTELVNAYCHGRGGPGGWWILYEVDVVIEPGVQAYRPDIVGWRKECVPAIPKEQPVPILPDFVCEVLSPSKPFWDRGPKKRGYERAGVPWLWLLDPSARRLEAYQLVDREYREVAIVSGATPARVEPFAEIEIDVAELFPVDEG